MVKVKTFILALSYFPQDLDKFSSFLNDGRLSQAEKDIIRAWIMLRDGDYDDLLVKVEKIVTHDLIVLALKHLVIGTALINKGQSDKALSYIQMASVEFEKTELERQKFQSQLTLFMAHLNLKNTLGMAQALEKMEEFKSESKRQETELYRARFNYFHFTGNIAKSKMCLKKLEQLKEHMSESQRSFLLVDQFNFYLKLDEWKNAEACLEEMKNFRKFQLKSNYKFMRKVLDFTLNDKPLYLYLNEFEGQGFLYHQVDCLLSLSTGEEARALAAWNNLQAISPEIYQNDFCYQGEKCLFQMALQKITAGKKQSFEVSVPVTGDKEALCLSLLLSGKAISQNELFLKIWGREAVTKDELARLRKLISRVREKAPGEIVSSKGTYCIKKSA